MDPNSTVPAAPTDEATDDDELVRRTRQGDLKAYETLMRRHDRRLYRAIRSVLVDEAEIEDTMQETYVLALRHLDQFEHRAQFSTWLIKIGVHEALARMRQRMRVVPLDDIADSPAVRAARAANDDAAPRTPEQQASTHEIVAMVEASLDRLPYDYRQVFVLRVVESMGTSETAQVLGMNEAAVRQRLHRAREMLQSDIAKRVGSALDTAFGFLGARCDRVVATVLARLGAGTQAA